MNNFNKYYESMKNKLLSMKKLGLFKEVIVSDSYIDPNVDLILNIFSEACFELNSLIELSSVENQNNLLKSLYYFLFQIKPSCFISSINLKQDVKNCLINRNEKLIIIDEEEYTYSSYNSYYLKNIEVKSNFVKTDDLNVFFGQVSFFLKINIILKHKLSETLNDNKFRFIIFNSNASEICKIIASNKFIYYINKNNKIEKIGNIYKVKPINLISENYNIVQHIESIFNYFFIPESYNIFEIIFDNILYNFTDLNFNLLIPSNKFFNDFDFIYPNPILFSNTFNRTSASFNLYECLSKDIYIDYDKINNLFINDIVKVCLINKETSEEQFIKCYGAPIFEIQSNSNIYSSVDYRVENNNWRSRISIFINSNENDYLDILEKNIIYFNCICTQNIFVRPSVVKYDMPTFLQFKKVNFLTQPSASIICNFIDNNINLRIFYTNVRDIFHFKNSIEIIAELFYIISLFFNKKYDLLEKISSINISDKISVINIDNKYTSNIIVHYCEIKTNINCSNIDYAVLYCLELIFTSLIPFNAFYDIKFICDKTNSIIYQSSNQ